MCVKMGVLCASSISHLIHRDFNYNLLMGTIHSLGPLFRENGLAMLTGEWESVTCSWEVVFWEDSGFHKIFQSFIVAVD